MGLGLDIDRRILVGRHGGDIRVHSSPGETRFSVRLAVGSWEKNGGYGLETGKKLIKEICSEKRGVNTRVLEQTITLAVEIAREGREGRKIGTLFVVGDSEAVLKSSRPLILDPLAGHPDEKKRIDDPDARETLKELAQLDGAFVVSDESVVLSAARYIDTVSEALNVPLGLGSRHMAAASVSKRTNAVAVVVSESSMVRMFDDGELVSEIVPEIWMLGRYSSQLEGPTFSRRGDGLTVVGRDD